MQLLPMVTGQLADTPTRGLPTRGLDKSRTGQLADATGDFVCLVFVLLAASGDRELSSPRLVQSASWQSASWRIRELSSNRLTDGCCASMICTAVGRLLLLCVYTERHVHSSRHGDHTGRDGRLCSGAQHARSSSHRDHPVRLSGVRQHTGVPLRIRTVQVRI